MTGFYIEDQLRELKPKLRKVFFYRICGTGMGACATLFHEAGFEVSGADTIFFPPMSTYLEGLGFELYSLDQIHADPSFLESFDLIIVGNVVANNSLDAQLIEKSGVPYASFPRALGTLILEDLNVVGFSGTHGKTTSTYLAAQVFENLGINAGYFIGGVMDGRPSARLGEKFFFIESDEYDSAYFEKFSKFRSYNIDHLVVSSLEFDHADIFDTEEDIKDEFRALFPSVTETFILNTDYNALKGLWTEYIGNIVGPIWIDYGAKSTHGPFGIKTGIEGSQFKLKYNEETLSFKTNLVGRHNILNLSSLLLFALSQGFSYEEIKPTILNLKLVKRRQEERGTYNGAIIVDDFAHHPRAVGLTYEAISKKYPEKEVTIIFEPNSATARSSLFYTEFLEEFKKSKSLMITVPNRKTSVRGGEDLDCQKLVNDFSVGDRNGYLAKSREDIIRFIKENASPEKVFLFMSNGTCLGFWESEFVNDFK